MSTNRVIESVEWSADAGRVKGVSDEAKVINSYLDALKQKAYQYQKELILYRTCLCGGKKMNPMEISAGVDGEQWIFVSRQKTESSSRN